MKNEIDNEPLYTWTEIFNNLKLKTALGFFTMLSD